MRFKFTFHHRVINSFSVQCCGLFIIGQLLIGCETPQLSPLDYGEPRLMDMMMEIPLTSGEMTGGVNPDTEIRAGMEAGTGAGMIIAGDEIVGGGEAGDEMIGGEAVMAGQASQGGEFMTCGTITENAIPALMPVDIIWVIDSSPSMGEEISQVQANLNLFAERIGLSGLDLRVALVAAEEDIATPDRDYLGVCIPPPLSAVDQCPDVDSPHYRHIRLNVHSSDPLAKMIEAWPALSDFIRRDSLKHLVFVTDDDAGWEIDQAEFLAFVDGNPSLTGLRIHSIVDEVGYQGSCALDDSCSCGDERGQTYIDLSQQTMGEVFSVCEADWDPRFRILEERVVEGTDLPCAFAFPEGSQSVLFSPDEVNIFWAPEGAAESLVPRVDRAAECLDQEGWYYDDPIDPEVIHLCPASCGARRGMLRLEFGCMVVKR